METVQNVLNTATKAIWGESNTAQQTATNETGGSEPVSGEEGAGTAEEPFDKGNAEQNTAKNESGGQEPLSGVTGAGTAAKPFDKGNDQDVEPNTSAHDGTHENTTPPQKSDTVDSTHRVNVDEILAKSAAIKGGDRPAAEKREESVEGPEDKTISTDGQKGGEERGSATSTGVEDVKSTGLATDSGEAGAHQEADHSLQDKAVKPSADDDASKAASTESTGETSKEKSSKLDRLKDKLQDKLHISSSKH